MIRDSYCDGELRGPAKLRMGQTIVLNQHKWNGILNHLNRNQMQNAISEQERQYQEYLRRGSWAMTNKWENSVEKIRQRKNQERIRNEQQKVLDGERRYRALKENDERLRQFEITKAQDLMKRLKVGPRNLESAYLLSEVLRGQEIQQQMNAKINAERRRKEMADGRERIAQAEQWTNAQKQKMLNEKSMNNNYKKNLYRFIQDEEVRRTDESQKQILNERNEGEFIKNEIHSQIEQERTMLQRKKNVLRENALEAMRVAEQRRLREQMAKAIEDKMVQVYAEGKERIAELKREKEQELVNEKNELREEVATKLYAQGDDKLQLEIESMKRAQRQYECKQTAMEQQRLEHNRKMKAARIHSHLQEMEQNKLRQQQNLQQYQNDVNVRLQNEAVHFEYEKQQRQQQYEKSFELRNIIQRQMAERQTMETNRYEQSVYDDRQILKTYENDDKEFFQYANELIREAKQKGRPTLPIIKTIEDYKKHNALKLPIENLPHLKSMIPIGVKEVAIDCVKDQRETDQIPAAIIKYNIVDLKNLNPFGKI